ESNLETLLVRPLDAADRREPRTLCLHLGDGEQGLAVPHGTAHAMLHTDLARQVSLSRIDAAPARLQPEKSAAGCRNADRAAAIRCMGERHHAGSNCRRRAAG